MVSSLQRPVFESWVTKRVWDIKTAGIYFRKNLPKKNSIIMNHIHSAILNKCVFTFDMILDQDLCGPIRSNI